MKCQCGCGRNVPERPANAPGRPRKYFEVECRRRAWEAVHRKRCVDCQELLPLNATGRPGYVRCWSCEAAGRTEAKKARLALIADLWSRGLSLREIAEECGGTDNSIGTAISEARADGDERFPHRYTMDGGKRVAA
jgi:hypothetical protein